MKLTPKEIKEGNALIANAIGYTYYHPGVLVENEEYGGYRLQEIFSRIPIEVFDDGSGQIYFKELPNPDYGNEDSERFNHNFEKLDWDIIHRWEFISDPKYHLDWNEFMHAWGKFSTEILTYERCDDYIVAEMGRQMKNAMIENNISSAFDVFVKTIKWHQHGLLKK